MVDRVKSSERHLRAQQAKEFLISQVVAEAQKENVPLSEVERKMLFFTETQETLPDMLKINDQFEREYDSSAYEKKIAHLLHNAYKRSRRESPDGQHHWIQAIADLRKEDHYLLVMVDQAGLRQTGESLKMVDQASLRPPRDSLKLLATGLAVAVVLLGVTFGASLLATKYNVDLDKYFPSKDAFAFVMWIAAVGLAILYAALRCLLGGQRVDDLLAKIIKRVFISSSREK